MFQEEFKLKDKMLRDAVSNFQSGILGSNTRDEELLKSCAVIYS